jgi:hypothetical protein
MLKFWTKKLETPATNETRQIDVVQLWEVRWYSMRISELGDEPRFVLSRTEVECFLSEDEAKGFRDSLIKAQKLLRLTGSFLNVSVEKSA